MHLDGFASELFKSYSQMQPLDIYFCIELMDWICINCQLPCVCAATEQVARDWILTVDSDLDDPEVDFTPGHDAALAGVVTLICLLDATDLKVVVAQDFETDCGWESNREKERERGNTKWDSNYSWVR